LTLVPLILYNRRVITIGNQTLPKRLQMEYWVDKRRLSIKPHLCSIDQPLTIMFWYEEDVKQLETIKATLRYEPETIFYGSSSIRQWEGLYEEFRSFHPVNLGFGGSTLAACVWFFERILKPYKPKHIVCYAGDNDLGDGRHPEEVYIFFLQLLDCLDKYFPDVPFTYISIKPSIARQEIIKQISYTNSLIKKAIEQAGGRRYYVNVFSSMLDDKGFPQADLFEADGLHMNEKGYAIWNEILLQHLASNI